jgi:hypothetical protein
MTRFSSQLVRVLVLAVDRTSGAANTKKKLAWKTPVHVIEEILAMRTTTSHGNCWTRLVL